MDIRMKHFPGPHEEKITISIISFVAGLSIGVVCYFLEGSIKDLIPAIATLIAAFMGAWIAFLLQKTEHKKQFRESNLESANKLLYILYERLNTIKLFQIDFVEPTRGSPGQMITMQPVLDFRSPKSEFSAEDVAFLFQTKYRALIFTLHVANEQFHETVKSIRHRSHLHLNVYQPLMERAGYQSGTDIDGCQIRDVIGDRNYHLLEQSTEVVVGNVDKFVERGDQFRKDLINAFSDIFTPSEVFQFELLDQPTNNQIQPKAYTSAD